MQFLKAPESYQSKLSGSLDELISDIQFIPFTAGYPEDHPGWCSLSGDTNDGWSYDQSGWFRVQLQPVMLDVLKHVRTIYEVTLENFAARYYLELSRMPHRGTFLYLRYQQILGGRCLMQLDDDAAFGWINRARLAQAPRGSHS